MKVETCTPGSFLVDDETGYLDAQGRAHVLGRAGKCALCDVVLEPPRERREVRGVVDVNDPRRGVLLDGEWVRG